LVKAGRTLSRRAGRAKPPLGLPPLFFVTDRERTPDAEAVIRRLSRGCGVIVRTFGEAGQEALSMRLATVARRRGLVLLVGADARLAARIGAHGVHLPERRARIAGALRRAHPRWLITAAAHSLPAAIAARRAGAHAVILSPVFPSRSPSAGRALGPRRFAAIARAAGGPIFALGGVTTRNAPQLLGSGAVGIAAAQGLYD
jgi:thiamine-phosphate pyrophosphorylase